VRSTGVVEPRTRLEIKPPVNGRIEKVLVSEGQSVKRGAILAWMSSSERAALLDAARARGPKELARWEKMFKPAPLVAPLDGVVIARSVEPGQTVATDAPVIVMSDRLIIRAQVDETDLARITPGKTCRVRLDAYPDEALAARVTHVAYEARTVSNITVYDVTIEPDRPAARLRSGMTAGIVFLIARRADALRVPAEAVQTQDGSAFVLVPGGRSPVPVPVKIGLSDGARTEITEGIPEGAVVLIPEPPGGGSAP
jgi:macrolide-specific efflux system membrane fusion protein